MVKGKRVKSHHKSKGSSPRRKAIIKGKSGNSSSISSATRRVDYKSNKKKWISMAIYRTPLNPEQAVLSCCDSSIKNVIGGTAGSRQCIYLICGDSTLATSS